MHAHLVFLINGFSNLSSYQGPDGTGDYRSWLPHHTAYVGTTASPKEGTSEAMYLWRPARDNPPAWLRKDCIVGEIGWGVVDFGYLSRRAILRRKPITVTNSFLFLECLMR